MPEIVGDLITAYRDLFTKGQISVGNPKDLGSGGNILREYFPDLTSKGDSFFRAQPDLSSKSWVFIRSLSDLGSIASLFRPCKDLQSKGHIELIEFVSPKVILERTDLRAQFPKHPIARLKISVGIPLAYEKVYSSFNFNAGIRQIVLEIPELGGDTLKLQLLDEVGAVLYESASQNENQKVSILLTTPIPLVGNPSIGILLSGIQSVARNVIVYLYGR